MGEALTPALSRRTGEGERGLPALGGSGAMGGVWEFDGGGAEFL
jgi:hypothetical protein